jgi:hypothetical protein
MEALTYTHLLKCLDYRGTVKYELPCFFVKELKDYYLFDRPYPIVHHKRKNKDFILANPEFILVSKTEGHCISIGHQNYQPVAMYININHPPKAHENGFSWLDLELDLKLQFDQGWHYQLIDEDEFRTAALTYAERTLALEEIENLIKRIKELSFPFNILDCRKLINH